MDTHVPRLLRVSQVAEQTGLEKWRIYQLLKAGQGPPFLRIGRTIRVSEPALVRWIQEREQMGANA